MSRVSITSTRSQYDILKQVAHTSSYRLYLCKDASGTGYLLQIAAERASNGGLERAAFVLRMLMNASRRRDREYAITHEGKRLHYDRLFPELVETFISSEQQERRVNILAFTDVPDVARLLPLSNLKSKDRLRIDPKTDAWILGRVLKLLTLVHAEGITVRTLSANNILLERDLHFSIILDWSSAWMHPELVPLDDATTDIARAAQAAYGALGDVNSGNYSFEDADLRYIDLLRLLKDGGVGPLNALQAHTLFYEQVREIWPDEFHPFTALPL